MATVRDVMDSLIVLAQAQVAALPSMPTTIIRAGWPPVQALQDAGKNGTMLINAYTAGTPRHTTRWAPSDIVLNQVTAGTTITQSAAAILTGGTITVTLAGGTIANDGVGFNATVGRAGTGAAAVAVAGDTAASLAAKLVAAIAANATLAGWVSAAAVGGTITVRNLTPTLVRVVTVAGNIANARQEVWRILRPFQMHLWAPSEALRQQVGDALDGALGQLSANYGPTFSDGTMARLLYDGDAYNDSDILLNLYRRDFTMLVEYGVLALDVLYPVLVPGFKLEQMPTDPGLTGTTLLSPGA
jgi:hypothetical protein